MGQPTTHLGNRQLHRRHSVMIEGGSVPRARVMDQRAFDTLLMQGEITLDQHIAAEKLMQQAGWAGMWPAGMNWKGTGGSEPGCRVPFGVHPWGDSLAEIRRALSQHHARLIERMIIMDCNVSGHLDEIREALDVIARVDSYNPVSRLRKVSKAA